MIIKNSSNSHTIKKKGEELDILLISDVHFDSLKCDRELLKKHFDQIKEKKGRVLIIGDWFDVMGTFQDPRSKPDQVRSEYYQKGRSYLDLIVEDSFEFLKPYRENLAIIGYGNHESNISRRHDTDIIDRLVFLLNMEGNCVHKGGYQGAVKFELETPTKVTFKLAYHHGHGGAKRSKGVLNSQLDAMKYRFADCIVSGHDHNKIHDPSNVVFDINTKGQLIQKAVHWLKLGSYKKSSTDHGFEVERGFFPSKLGGWFLNLKHNRMRFTVDGKEREKHSIIPTFTEAT